VQPTTDTGSTTRTAGVSVCVLALLVSCAAAARGATLVDPALRFRNLATEHFIIHFHQGEDRLASELAAIAEDTWTALQRPFGAAPPKLTHVILVDQTELSNGFATPLPYNTVLVTAVWPAGSEFIGDTEDWLRLVFTHEFTHIVHLDRSEGWARVLRGIFGRTALAFPNLFLPAWQIEGLATYEETAITGGGRVHAGDFRAITAEAARAGRREPLGRVNGGLIDWPGGYAPYAYGVGFHTYLAERYGDARFAELASATARRVPYTASRVFARVFGRSLGALWTDYQASLIDAAGTPPPPDAGLARLTHHGFFVAGPRFVEPRAVVYAVRTPHGFPALNTVTLDGAAPRRLATRYLGSTTAVTAGAIYFDQQELRRNTGVYSDLYRLDRRSGRVRRLTTEARLLDPDMSPDGRTLACAQDAPGRRDLVLVGIAGLKPPGTRPAAGAGPARIVTAAGQASSPAITILASGPGTQFNAPRWSPDGRLIAVERHHVGAQSEIVIVDVATGAVRILASRADARIVTPAWRPDGQAIVAALSASDEPFNLYEFPIDPHGGGEPAGAGLGRQITHTTGGALWPDVSPDGKTIVFAGYTVDGSDLFTLPYPPARQATAGADAQAAPPEGVTFEGPRHATRTDRDARPGSEHAPSRKPSPYRPWPTLKPTSWSPVFVSDASQIRVGAALAAYDVLQYHAYIVSASWLVSGPGGAIKPAAATPDWQVYYAYGRWRPTFWLSASTQTSFFAGPATDTGAPASALERARQIQAGVLFPILHVRTSHTALASLVREVDDFSLPTLALTFNRSAARAAWSTSSAHIYGYSISPESGATIGVTSEWVRRALGAFADATTVTADARAYFPSVAPHHVFALRVAGGTSAGNVDMKRTFLLGGGASNPSVLDFGANAISLLRGFGADTFAGSHVGLLNADYRFPLARPQRGVGTWPLFLQTIHAAVFADAGHTWTRTFRARDLKTAEGAELSTDFVAGYVTPLTATVGVAWGHDGRGSVADGARFYLRIGRAF
jgi:Tol biopolymer transport system component